ncbi:MAG: hypothetical protein C0446_14830, partial [Chitinophaga sp.]|nr:hypothetical protein [Chitinophaga sp.]
TLTYTGDLAVSKAVTSKMVQPKASVSSGLVDHLGLEVPKVKATLLERPQNYNKIISQIPGRVVSESDALRPGVLPLRLQETFSGGRYATIILDEPVVLNRVWAPLTQAKEFGGMWGLEKPLGIIQSRIDKALLPDWGDIINSPFKAQATHYVEVRAPVGTKIYIGEVSSQNGAWVGGTSQILVDGGVDSAWKIGGGALK